jgi:hypothetical protein
MVPCRRMPHPAKLKSSGLSAYSFFSGRLRISSRLVDYPRPETNGAATKAAPKCDKSVLELASLIGREGQQKASDR